LLPLVVLVTVAILLLPMRQRIDERRRAAPLAITAAEAG
jgi:hypothetical protein